MTTNENLIKGENMCTNWWGVRFYKRSCPSTPPAFVKLLQICIQTLSDFFQPSLWVFDVAYNNMLTRANRPPFHRYHHQIYSTFFILCNRWNGMLVMLHPLHLQVCLCDRTTAICSGKLSYTAGVQQQNYQSISSSILWSPLSCYDFILFYLLLSKK